MPTFKQVTSFNFRPRPGFTLIELMVSVSIMMLLMSLLIPAVQETRESSRRISCSNHLKQLGLAMHSYHELISQFPPGEITGTDNNGNLLCDPNGPAPQWGEFPGNWGTFLLAYLEQDQVYQKLDFQQAWFSDQNAVLYETEINHEIYTCPSHPLGAASFNLSGKFPRLIHYGAVLGSTFSPDHSCAASSNGLFHWNSQKRIRDVFDGTSQTLMLVEVLGYDPINQNPQSPDFLKIRDARGLTLHNQARCDVGIGPQFDLSTSPTPFNPLWNCPASFHQPAGIQVCFADGSVHFLSQKLDSETLSELSSIDSGNFVDLTF